MLAALLIAYPCLDGALFDRPHVIEMAKLFLHAFDAFRLTERIEFVPGDLFAVIPIEADLYLLKDVLQQWPDQAALAILTNCRNAMSGGARLAIIERLMPERASDDPSAVMVDLHMMTITGGRARSLAAFEASLVKPVLSSTKVTPTAPRPRHSRGRARLTLFGGAVHHHEVLAAPRVGGGRSSVVTSTFPGLMRLPIASITSGEPSMRSNTAELGAVAPVSSAWKPVPSQLDPFVVMAGTSPAMTFLLSWESSTLKSGFRRDDGAARARRPAT